MPDNNFKTFGQALVFYRERNLWTRQDASEAIGTSKNAYNRFEGGYEGYTKPNRDLVVKYAKALAPEAEAEFLVAAGYLPENETTGESVLGGVARYRLSKLKPERVAMVEATISFFFEQDRKANMLEEE